MSGADEKEIDFSGDEDDNYRFFSQAQQVSDIDQISALLQLQPPHLSRARYLRLQLQISQARRTSAKLLVLLAAMKKRRRLSSVPETTVQPALAIALGVVVTTTATMTAIAK